MEDKDYMELALRLAERGRGWTAPNPMVGAVIVKNGSMIGQGWHEAYGQLHAERSALASCRESPEGAVMYVTLEPCCHYGMQPPCTDAIIEAGIRRVVAGAGDPNPLVSGKGIRRLREAGIEVTEHVLQEECERINEIFFHYIRTNQPFVTMKYAMTADGKIASRTGASKWITGEEARRHVQELRRCHAAVMVGAGTVLADDPMLTCRLEGARQPVRILCDSRLRTPLTARVVATAKEFPTLLATCCREPEKQRPYREAGCRILELQEKNGHVDLKQLIRRLGKERIDSVLLEGGGALNWSALKSGIVQRVQIYIAPKLLGGENSKTPVEGIGADTLQGAILLKNSRIRMLGEDLLMEGEVAEHVYRNC